MKTIHTPEGEIRLLEPPVGQEFGIMIRRFIRALFEGAAATRLPIQEVIIGMDVRKRMQLGTIILSFMVPRNNLICLRATID